MRNLLLFFASCLSFITWSQTGSVLLNCVDQSTQKPLIACIQIESDSIVAKGCTDIKGKHKFSNIKSGSIRIHITHNGDTLIPRAAFIQTNQLLQLTIEISSNGYMNVASGNTYEESAGGEKVGGNAKTTAPLNVTAYKMNTAQAPTRLADKTLVYSDILCVAVKAPTINIDGTLQAAQIQRDEIQSMPLRTATGMASTVGGTNLNEGSGEMYVRGARSDANIYYLDGFRVNSLSGVPKAMMNQMTVYTGGIPAKYGDVTGGVIAIETKPIKGMTYGYHPFYWKAIGSRNRNTTYSTTQSSYYSKPSNYVEPISQNTFSMDRFTPIYENDFLSPAENPNSTFSIDVDRASWTYVQNQYIHGLTVSRDAVKLEEMINAFKYEKVKVPKEELIHVEVERSKCAWNENSELVTVHMKAQDLPEDEPRTAHNFVFLIDVSGSMQSNNKLTLLREGLINMVETLNNDDRVAIVTYAGNPGVVLEPTLCSDRKQIVQALDRLTAGGGTNGIGGIQTAYDLAEENFDSELNNRIILCTDGDFNVGLNSPMGLEEYIAERRGCGIYLTALGFGMGNYRNNVLEALADNGDGNHFYINNLAECKRVLQDEIGNLLNIARDVKLNIEFNPGFVAEYRLIGYENRLLQPRDFTDDTKDAGEIGYGHRVTAVYEVVLGKAKGTKADTTMSNRTQFEKNDLAVVKLRYKKFEEASSIERSYVLNERSGLKKNNLLNSVISFGLLLRDSGFKGSMTKEELATMASKLNGNNEDVRKLKEMIARYLVL